jgi:hypothetical protein
MAASTTQSDILKLKEKYDKIYTSEKGFILISTHFYRLALFDKEIGSLQTKVKNLYV